jgi:hypothetical protein
VGCSSSGTNKRVIALGRLHALTTVAALLDQLFILLLVCTKVGDELVSFRQALLHGLVGGVFLGSQAQTRVLAVAHHARSGYLLQNAEPES